MRHVALFTKKEKFLNIEICEHANKILENYQDLTGAPEDYIIEMLIYKLYG